MNEDGFVLVTSILVLIVLTLIGTAMFNTSLFETIIAGSEKMHQAQFFTADGGVNAFMAQASINRVPPPDAFIVPNFDRIKDPNHDTFDCNNPVGIPFSSLDIDGNPGDDISLYMLLKDPSVNPPELRVASCLTQSRNAVKITVGVQYGLPAGGMVTNNPLGYN